MAGLRAAGATVALVPTMGALHEGHRALVARAAALADAVVVSIFLNPLQFAPGRGPRPLPAHARQRPRTVRAEGVAVVFAPLADEVYPAGEPMVRVAAGALGEVLEGASRPGHFDGVLTVVAKLFGLVRPDVAVFGEKDAQQLALVRQMVRDLDIPVGIEAVPIVRTAEGLALSSRNKYLDEPAAREAALALFARGAPPDPGGRRRPSGGDVRSPLPARCWTPSPASTSTTASWSTRSRSPSSVRRKPGRDCCWSPPGGAPPG